MVNCAQCGIAVTDPAEFLVNGCNICEGKKLTSRKRENRTPLDSSIGIYVKGTGEYVVNLKNLVEKEETDPLMVADSNGKINVLYE